LTFEQQFPWPTSSALGHIYIILKNGFVSLARKVPIFGRPAFVRIEQSDRNIPALFSRNANV
jgi:hypothetical protein